MSDTAKAVVTAVGPPLTVTIDGSTTPVPATRLASYAAPTVGHRVRVIVDLGTVLVLGQEV